MDAVGKLADVAKRIADTGARLIENLLGKPCAVAGGLLSDQIYAWQWGNRVRIAHKAQQILDSDRVAAKVLPPGFLLPLLQAAGNIGDGSLQDLWANLLAEGVKGKAAQHPAFIHALERMNSNDAQVFQRLVDADRRFLFVRGRGQSRTAPIFRVGRSEQYEEGIANLIALGLVRRQPVVEIRELRLDNAPQATIVDGDPELTRFGRAFAKVVLRRAAPTHPESPSAPAVEPEPSGESDV